MRRIVIIAIILIILALSIIVVYNNYVDSSNKSRIDIRGTVTNITVSGSTANMLIEGQIESDTYYDKASVRVEQKTLITKFSMNRNIDVGTIKVGDKVEVKFKGPVAESYPVQATAELVNITK